MESLNVTRLCDTEEFKAMKKSAWDCINGHGEFDIDDLEPAQYKYFHKLLRLYGKHKDKKITAQQSKTEEQKIYLELQNYVDERLDYLHDRMMLAENLKCAYEEISKAEKSSDVYELAGLLADAVGKFIGDESFGKRTMNRLEMAEGNVGPLSIK